MLGLSGLILNCRPLGCGLLRSNSQTYCQVPPYGRGFNIHLPWDGGEPGPEQDTPEGRSVPPAQTLEEDVALDPLPRTEVPKDTNQTRYKEVKGPLKGENKDKGTVCS